MAAKSKSGRAAKKTGSEFERVTKMNARELAAETKKFEREFAADEFVAPEDKAKTAWKKFKRRVGRPKKGQGCVRVSVSMERGLLEAVDKLARRRKLKRAELIAGALSSLLNGSC